MSKLIIFLALLIISTGCVDNSRTHITYSVDLYAGDTTYHFDNIKESDINVYTPDISWVNPSSGGNIHIYSIYRNGREYKSSHIFVY